MSAIKSGLRIIKGEVFIILSADLQDPPELIIDMVKLWENGEEFVYCERITRGDPLATQIFSRFFLISCVFISVVEFSSGFAKFTP